MQAEHRLHREVLEEGLPMETLRRVIDSPEGPIMVINARDLSERPRALTTPEVTVA